MKKNLFQILIIAVLGISLVSQSLVSEYLLDGLSIELKLQDKDAGDGESDDNEVKKETSEDKFFNSYGVAMKGAFDITTNGFYVKNDSVLVISTEIPTPPPDFI
jgi:hypothetical protein